MTAWLLAPSDADALPHALLTVQQRAAASMSVACTHTVRLCAAARCRPPLAAICSNIIGNHPGVISVAASGAEDESLEFGPKASPCIDLWAPSGDVGTGLWGASAAGPSNYTRVLSRSTGAAAVAVGVAAQYLELNPNATAAQVREALVDGSTRGVVAGAAPGVRTGLLFTNYSEEQEEAPAVSTVQGQPAQPRPEERREQPAENGGGLDTGALVAIIVASCVGECALPVRLVSMEFGVCWQLALYSRAGHSRAWLSTVFPSFVSSMQPARCAALQSSVSVHMIPAQPTSRCA